MSKKNENVNIDNIEPTVTEAPAPNPIIFGTVSLPKEYKKLNVRAEAKMNAKVLYTVSNKAKLEVELLKTEPNWVKVIAKDGGVGYCMKKFVTIKQ